MISAQPEIPVICAPAKLSPAPVSITRKLFGAAGRVSLYQCAGVLLGFGFQAFISRTCGADALGAITLFLSWLGILSILTLPGLEGCLVYFLPRFDGDPHSTRRVLNQCLTAAGAASLLLTAGIALAGPRLFAWIGLPDSARAAFCVALIAFSAGKLLDAVFLGFKEAPMLGYFNNIRTVARLAFSLPVLLYPTQRWTILFYAIAAECILAVVLRCVRLQRHYPGLLALRRISAPANPAQKIALGAVAFPMLGISAVDTVYPLLDKAVLGIMVPLALVGVYRAADAVATVNSMFVLPFLAFWPYISQLHAEQRLDDLRESYRSITLLITALMLPFTLVLIELCPFILSLFGKGFASQGRNILLILAFGTAIDAIAGPAGAVLKLTGNARIGLMINLTWLAVYLGLAVALTKPYGIVGVAIAKTISTVLGNLANITANRRLLGVFPYSLRHGWLMLVCVAILLVRWLIFPRATSVAGQALAGFIQAAAFVAFAAFLLRPQISRVLSTISPIHL